MPDETPPVRRPVTMRDLAGRLGVNQSTVSRALRDDPKVSVAVRERIRAAAVAAGYRPNPYVAAFTAQVRSYRRARQEATLAILDGLPRGSRGYFLDYADHASARAEALGFRTEVHYLQELGGSLPRLVKVLKTRSIRGLLVLPDSDASGRLSGLSLEGLAAATLDPTVRSLRLHRAESDYFLGMRQCLEEVAARGYRRPLYCAMGEELKRIAEAWLGAYALEMARRPREERLEAYILEGWDRTGFKACVREQRPDCIVSNDVFFFDWAAELGLGPPDMGNAYLSASERRPAISGVHQRGALVAAAAVDLIVAQIHRNEYGEPAVPKRVLIEPVWWEGRTLRPRVRGV